MNTWAVIRTGGKQYKVAEGESIAVEKLPEDKKDIILTEVLALSKEGQVQVGKPLVAGVKVHIKILENFKDKKVRVVKFKSKSKYLRTTGHRHQKTKILIEKIAS